MTFVVDPVIALPQLASGAINSLVPFLLLYLMSHLMRVIRLYVLLLEEQVGAKRLLQVYFVTIWPSFFLPYKLGEFVRIGGISRLCLSLRRGLATVWVERFFDAVILSVLLFIYLMSVHSDLSMYAPIAVVLVVFFGFSLLYFLEYAQSFNYLNQFLMSKSQSRRGIYLLKVIHSLRFIHADVKGLIRGRSTLLLFLSVAIWGVELGSVYVLSRASQISSLAQSFVVLLNATLVSPDASHAQFIAFYRNSVSVVLMVIALPLMFGALANYISRQGKTARRSVVRQYKLNAPLVALDESEDEVL